MDLKHLPAYYKVCLCLYTALVNVCISSVGLSACRVVVLACQNLCTRLRLLIWGFTSSLRLWPQGMQEPWRAQMEFVAESWSFFFFFPFFSQARARRESHPSGQGTLLPRGASHWPYNTDWASVGGWTPWLHGHQRLACSTEAGSELDQAKAVTCFRLDFVEDLIQITCKILQNMCSWKRASKVVPLLLYRQWLISIDLF